MRRINALIAMLIWITPQASASLPTSQFPGTEKTNAPAPRRVKPAAAPEEPRKARERSPSADQAIYTHPGSLVFRGGRWEGHDYLFNLTKQIGVFVEIGKPEGLQIDLSEQRLKNVVEDILRKGGIAPLARNDEDEPGLPFLHVQILIYPVGNGYAIAAQERLFEAVSVKRVHFDRGEALQAITWEKQSLLVLPADQLVPRVEKSVVEMTNSFVQLFHVYESLKK